MPLVPTGSILIRQVYILYICSPLVFGYCRLPVKFMASVKPPLDKHSQNLTLHCIELQHHKRRMRLMLMAAQHQHGEGGVSLFIVDPFVHHLSNKSDAFNVFSFIFLLFYHPLVYRLNVSVTWHLILTNYKRLCWENVFLRSRQDRPRAARSIAMTPVSDVLFHTFITSIKTSSYQTNLFLSEVRGC